MSDYSGLKKAAEAATQGKWDYEQDCLFFYIDGYTKYLMELSEGDDVDGIQQIENAKFIAAANPAAILALIAENERLVRRDQMLAEVGCEYCGGSGYVHRIDGECLGVCDQCLAYDLACAKHECDQLRAENAGLRTGYEAYERVNAELKAEVEVLLKALRVATVQMWNSDANMDVEAQTIEAVLARSKGEQS